MNSKTIELIEKIKNTEDVKLTIDGFKATLEEHQRRDVAAAYAAHRSIVADDCGLGKTVVAIALMQLLKNKGKASHFFIIAEASAKRQWADEIKKFSDLSTLIIAGPKRAKDWPTYPNYDVVICSYELIHRDYIWFERVARDSQQIIIDEASILKNSQIKTTKRVKNILRFDQRVLLLTATPLDKRLEQLHSLFEILDPYLLGTYYNFQDMYCNLQWDEIWTRGKDGQRRKVKIPKVISYKNLDDFKRRISPYYIRHTADTVKMPEQVLINRYFDLSKKQQKIYDELEDGLIREIDGYDRITALQKFTRLIQCCDNPSIINDEYPDESVKLDYIKTLLTGELEGQKILIFSKFMGNILKIREMLDGLGIKYGNWTGDAKQADRDKDKQKFKDGEIQIMLLTLAGERGISLNAPYMICVDQVFNAQRMKQIYGRARRKDSPYKSVTVFNLITANTVEDDMFKRIDEEGRIFTDIFGDADKEIVDQMSPEQMKKMILERRKRK